MLVYLNDDYAGCVIVDPDASDDDDITDDNITIEGPNSKRRKINPADTDADEDTGNENEKKDESDQEDEKSSSTAGFNK